MLLTPVLGSSTDRSIKVKWFDPSTESNEKLDEMREALKTVSHFSVQWAELGPADKPLTQDLATIENWQTNEMSLVVRALGCGKNNLKPSTWYSFRVKACNSEGQGEWGPPSVPLATKPLQLVWLKVAPATQTSVSVTLTTSPAQPKPVVAPPKEEESYLGALASYVPDSLTRLFTCSFVNKASPGFE